jgi:hypothetical protein
MKITYRYRQYRKSDVRAVYIGFRKGQLIRFEVDEQRRTILEAEDLEANYPAAKVDQARKMETWYPNQVLVYGEAFIPEQSYRQGLPQVARSTNVD